MLEKEKKYQVWVAIIMFFALLLLDKTIEAILVLIIGHLIEIKYELKSMNNIQKKSTLEDELEAKRITKAIRDKLKK